MASPHAFCAPRGWTERERVFTGEMGGGRERNFTGEGGRERERGRGREGDFTGGKHEMQGTTVAEMLVALDLSRCVLALQNVFSYYKCVLLL